MAKRCTMSPVGDHVVESDTTTKKYMVTVREDGRNTCNCTGFVTKRNKLGGLSALGQPECTCKHVKGILAGKGCGWNSETGKKQVYPFICPVCSCSTEDYTPPAPPKVDEEMLNDTMAGLLALRERMRT